MYIRQWFGAPKMEMLSSPFRPVAGGGYKIRFFGVDQALLFEIRQIQDPVLIVEKYNFGHAGMFQYELYRDNSLVERNNFRIDP